MSTTIILLYVLRFTEWFSMICKMTAMHFARLRFLLCHHAFFGGRSRWEHHEQWDELDSESFFFLLDLGVAPMSNGKSHQMPI